MRSPDGASPKEQPLMDPYFSNDFSDCWFGPNNEPLAQDGWQDSDQTGIEAAIMTGVDGCMDFGAHLKQKTLRKHRFSLDQEDIEPFLEDDQPEYPDNAASDPEDDELHRRHKELVVQKHTSNNIAQTHLLEAGSFLADAAHSLAFGSQAHPVYLTRNHTRVGGKEDLAKRHELQALDQPEPLPAASAPSDPPTDGRVQLQEPKKKVLLEWMSTVERRQPHPQKPKQQSGQEDGRPGGLIAKKSKKFEKKSAGKKRSASSSRERAAPKRQRTESHIASVRSNVYYSKVLSKAEKLVRYWKDPSKQIPIVFKALTRAGDSDPSFKQEIDLSNRKLMMTESPPINEAARDKSNAQRRKKKPLKKSRKSNR